jgi:hypothetical protein|nr:MAG TPA: hypothetical protein [Caudoviricetes sp.]
MIKVTLNGNEIDVKDIQLNQQIVELIMSIIDR